MEKVDYTSTGYDEFLRRSKPAPPEFTEDITQIERPQLPATSIKGELGTKSVQKAVEELVQISGLQSGSSLSISLTNGQQATLTSTITDSVNPERVMKGIVEITVYEDVPGSGAKRIPESIGLSSYQIHSGYDYHDNETSASPKKGLTFMYTIRNNSGSTHTIYFVFRWRYLGRLSALSV